MSYGKRLNQAIKHAKTTRQKLAKAIGMSVQAVGLVINGKSNAFTAYNNTKAAQFLGVSSDWLATGEDVTPNPLVLFSQEAQRIAHWFDKLPDDPAIRAAAENRLMTVVIVALECAKQGVPLGLVQIGAAAPHAAPKPSPSPSGKRGKQSA